MRPEARLFAFICFVAGLALFWLWSTPFQKRMLAGDNDFLQVYSGARLLGTPELYNVAANRIEQVKAVGHWLPGVSYTRPPFYAAILRPLTGLGYHATYAVFQCLSVAAFAIAVFLLIPLARDLIFLAPLSLPAMTNFIGGQDVTLTLLFATLSLHAFRRGRPFLSGLLLAICAIKFHIFVLIPLAVILCRQWRVLYGALTGGAFLTAISFAVAPDWLSKYPQAASNPDMNQFPQQMTAFRSVLWDLQLDTTLANVAAGLLIALLVAAAIYWSAGYERAFAIALLGGLLVCYHAYMHDSVLLLIPFAILSVKREQPAPAVTGFEIPRGVRPQAPVKSAAESSLPVTSAQCARILWIAALLPPLYMTLMAPVPFNTLVALTMLLLLTLAAKEAYDRRNRAAAGH